MDLRERFDRWVEWEIGSSAPSALRRHLRDNGYRLFSCIEVDGCWNREVYHPRRGFYRASGWNEAQALLAILRQIWLTDSIDGVGSEVGPASDRS